MRRRAVRVAIPIVALPMALLVGCSNQPEHHGAHIMDTARDPDLAIEQLPSALPSDAASPSGAASTPTATTAATPAAGSALQMLAKVAVKGRAPHTGYTRKQFGSSWPDVDHNGCDTRNDILNRDLTDKTWRDSRHCVVLSGALQDPYTGRTLAFDKVHATKVQIDHVVALSDAWETGAQQLTTERRTLLANDPLNLLAVDGPTNEAKGDSDAASWLPPAKAYRCAYVSRQVAVKLKYALWMTRAEADAIRGLLQTCPQQPLPKG